MEGKGRNIVEHKTVKIPKELITSIEEIIAKNPQLGYVSSSEFIKECVRMRIREDFLKTHKKI